jgi:hypothetical protein
MKEKIEKHLEGKIENSTDPLQKELDVSLLNLYRLGFIDITLDGEDLNIFVTDAGTEAFMNDVSLSLADPKVFH